MASTSRSSGAFDRDRLDAIAARVRVQEATSALTLAAATRKPDPNRWPKLTFRTFEVAAGVAAVSPDCSYRLLESAIANAKKTLVAYVYNIGSSDILALLRDRLSAGVQVRIMVDPNDPNDGKSQEFANLQKLQKFGKLQVSLAPASSARSVFSVCHQKFVVADGRTTVVESANWAATAIPKAKPGQYVPGNREWLIRIDDSDVAAWFVNLFDQDLAIPANVAAAVMASAHVDTVLEPSALFVKPEKLFDLEVAKMTFRVRPVVSPDNYQQEIGKLLKGAKQRIWLQQQYITAGNGVNDLLQIVHDKATTCDVRIIASPKFRTSWVNTMDTLKAAGLFDRLRAQNLTHVIHCHNKGVLVDDEQVVVSSTNWSENSITRARETGLLIRSRQLTSYFASVFELDWKNSTTPKLAASDSIAISASEMV